ncbi:hypothetical protein AVEN_150748-1 [Araneus ventricosus]|uniref:RNA-directed DNA polymerase n=1 Tax=Araneus ventricosus TaxID=182803 RepID=A0A4Y2EXT8_ARAVE|nr:hypothetical protein AVEN_150748-1 [Araneus ventricosus]
MRGCRIIIPKSHQAEVLNQIHEGHLGITKCRARAGCSVYWPRISKLWPYSSPKFSQSNGLIEAAVKTVKARIKKSRDPYLALMAYRATPLENGFSPSELLMARRINTTLPVAKTQLQPYSVNKEVLEAKEEIRRPEKEL